MKSKVIPVVQTASASYHDDVDMYLPFSPSLPQNTVLNMASLLNVVATYYENLKCKVANDRPCVSTYQSPITQVRAVLSIVETLEQVESLVSSVVEVLPQSAFLATVLNAVKSGFVLV